MKGLCKKIAATTLAFLMLVSVLITAVPPEGLDWAMEAEAAEEFASTVVSASYDDMLERAKSYLNYEWVPSKDIKTWNNNSYNGSTTFKAGTTVTGVPYTLFIGGVRDLDGFKQVKDKNYTHSGNCSVGYRTGPYYGSCCATYVSEIFGISPRIHSVSTLNDSGKVKKLTGQTANQIKIGDAVSTPGHIIWIADITDEYFLVYEQTPPVTRVIKIYKSKNVDSDGFLWYGKNSDGSKKYYKTIARINITGNSTPSTPTYANLTVSANDTAVGKSVSLYASSDHATSYKLWISDATTWEVVKEITTTDGNFSVSGLPKGKYRAYVTASNSAGYIDSEGLYFSMVTAPTSAAMSVSKSSYGLGEKVNFSFSANEPIRSYTVVISDRSDWKVVKKVSVTSDTYSTTDLPAGQYNAYVTAVNAAGYVDSNHVNFTVTDQLEADITVSANEFEVGDTVKFGFASNLGGKYKIWISDADSWELLHTATVNTDSYSINTLSNGNYCAYVTAINNSGYYADSEPVYFSITSDAWVNIWQKNTVYAVGETCTFSFDTNLNASKYKVWISNTSDWSLVHTSGQISETTYSVSTLPEGSYAAYVTAINEFAQIDSAIVRFTVTQKDQWSSLYINRKEYLPNENVEFGFASNISDNYTLWISDVSDWSVVRKVTVNGDSHIINDLPVGEYSAYTTAFDASSNVDSARVYFKVCAAPTSATIKVDKTDVASTDEVTFTFSSDTAANYKLWITDTTTWELYYSGTADGISYTTKLPEGSYLAYVTAYNRAGSADSSNVSVICSDALDKVELIVSKSIFLVGETVECTATYLPGAEYVLTLTNITEDTVTSMEVDSYSFSINDLTAGKYKACITAINSVSSVTSEEVEFTVASVPTSVSAKHLNRVSITQDIEFEITTDCFGDCTYDVIIADDESNVIAMGSSDTNKIVISGVEAGSYYVYVTAYNDFGAVTGDATTLVVYETTVELDKSELTLEVGEIYTFAPTVTPADTTDTLFWYVDEPDGEDPIASIDENGTLTAKRAGTTTVVAAIGEKYEICVVTVTEVDYNVTPNINGGASKLYEPWGLRYFAAFDGKDIDKIADRGIAILKDKYYTEGMTPEVFCANENAYVYMESAGELGYEDPTSSNKNGRYYATLTEGIYSYDISAYYHVVPFAVMENGQIIYGTIKKNSMERILNTNLGLTSISKTEKAICTCILSLKDSVAAHYAASGVPGASIDMNVPRGTSQTAAASVKTTSATGIKPDIVAGASRLIEPWGLRYFATYTDSVNIADRGVVILCEKYFDSSYKTAQDKMRLNANSYVFTESDSTLLYDEGSGRYYATVTEGISSKDIADVYYVVPYVVLDNGSYVYGTVKQNSMMKIMNTNLNIASVSETEKEVSRDIIALYEAVQAYYAA